MWKLKNKWIETMLDIISIVVFILIIVILVKGILYQIYMPKPEAEDLTFMLTNYLGLPFAFWLFISIGLMFGLPIHGFALVIVDSHNNEKTHYADQLNVIKDNKMKKG